MKKMQAASVVPTTTDMTLRILVKRFLAKIRSSQQTRFVVGFGSAQPPISVPLSHRGGILCGLWFKVLASS